MKIAPLTDGDLLSRLTRIGGLVGGTPLYELQRVFARPGVRVLAKLEWLQLGGSIKSRPGYNIILEAVRRGDYGRGQVLVDATSGNTGIAYSAVAAAAGLPVKICLPETASAERIAIMRRLGADLVLTPGDEGVDGAQDRVRRFAEADPAGTFVADQYANPDNWRAHYQTTGPEIVRQTDGAMTHFVCALGTSGTQMGVGRFLRDHRPDVRLVALQPTGGDDFEGWKHMATTGRVPPIYDPDVPDEFVTVTPGEADAMVRRLAAEEGLLVSPSAAGNLCGAIRVAERLDRGCVVTTFADDFSKYSADYERIFG